MTTLTKTALKRLAREARDEVRLVWGAGEHGYDRLAAALFLKLVEAEEKQG